MSIPLKNTNPAQTGFSSAEWARLLSESDALLTRYAAQTELPYCNIYVQNRLLHQGIYVSSGLTANQLIDSFCRDASNWQKIPKLAAQSGGPAVKLDHVRAFNRAASGRTAVIGFRHPDNAKSGHVAIVNAAAGLYVSGAKYWGTRVPAVDGYNPKTRRVETGESLSKQFSPSKESFMDYFVFAGNSNP